MEEVTTGFILMGSQNPPTYTSISLLWATPYIELPSPESVSPMRAREDSPREEFAVTSDLLLSPFRVLAPRPDHQLARSQESNVDQYR